MKGILLVLFLTAIHVHTMSGGYHIISVKTCDGKWADIYADKRMTMRMPNPFVSNADGSYEIHSPDKCIDISEWKAGAK